MEAGDASTFFARAAHTPELRSVVVAVLLVKPYKVPSPCKHGCKLSMASLIATRAKKVEASRQRQNEVLEYELLAQPAAMSQLTQEGNNDTFTGRIV